MGLLNLRWLSAYQDQLRQLKYFSKSFSKKEAASSFFFQLLMISHTCSMPRQEFFCTLSFAHLRKIVSKLSKLSAVLKL